MSRCGSKPKSNRPMLLMLGALAVVLLSAGCEQATPVSDTAPRFAAPVSGQTYTAGEAISSLTLPEASGGNGALVYKLEPTVPGLTFDGNARTLSGTPTAAGSYEMTYQVHDGDANTDAGDADTLSFTITVEEPDEPEPVDTAPRFAATVSDQTYTVGEAIGALTLPEASGGNGPLAYSLRPEVPGLAFDPATRTLSGTPTAADSYDMTYQAVDGDANTAPGDAATLTFMITVQRPEPPFSGTAFLNPSVITATDPTAFETLTYTGTGMRLMFDRRTDDFADTLAYLFNATYRDGLTIEMQVNAEFGSREAAELEAQKYAAYIGKIPTLLRESVETSWIHRGDYDFGGGNRNILIHTDRGEQYENGDYFPGGPGNYVEEILLHEGAHTSLDEKHAAAPGWLMAQAADPTFISTYARDHPAREDLAESFGSYLIVRYRADRTPAEMVETINATIPNRIAYFDAELAGSWCPLIPEDCPATPPSFHAALDSRMAEFMEERDIGAAAVGIMKNGVIIYDEVFGWMDKQRTVPLPDNVMMRLASVTKPITAAAIHELAADGKLDLDDHVFDLGQQGGGLLEIDPFPSLGDPQLAAITVQHLLQHRGGWDRKIAGDPMFYAIEIAEAMSIPSPPGRENMARYVLGLPLQFSPGSRIAYSNFGYLVLGLVIEEVSGRDYLSYVREHVFASLGVSAADVIQGRTLAADRSAREPWYDDRFGGRPAARNVFDPSGPLVPWPDGGWHLEALIAPGGLVASTLAILKFLDVHQVYGPNIGQRRRSPGWWYHTGSLDGTNTLALQRDNGVNYVVLFNRRRHHSDEAPGYVEEVRVLIDNLLTAHGIQGSVLAGSEEYGEREADDLHVRP